MDKLIKIKPPFCFSQKADKLFFEAMRESFLYYYDKSNLFKKLCYLDGFSKDLFLRYEDIFHIPHIYIPVIKYYKGQGNSRTKIEDLFGIAKEEYKKKKENLHRKSLVYKRLYQIIRNIYEDYGFINPQKEMNFLFLCLKNEFLPFGSKGNMIEGISSILKFLKVGKAHFIELYDEKGKIIYKNVRKTLDIIDDFSTSNIPLRIFSAYLPLYEIWKEYLEKSPRNKFCFGEESYIVIIDNAVFESYKDTSRKKIKRVFSKWLGLPIENIREIYSVYGHWIPFCSCEEGNVHVPVYSRVVVRDPETLRINCNNSYGLLHFYSPYVEAFPGISLLSSDLGIVRNNCPCGRKSPHIDIYRRKNPQVYCI